MTLILRSFEAADYAAFVNVWNCVHPDHATSVEEIRHLDENRGAHCVLIRWLALEDGDVAGAGEIRQHAWAYDPHGFRVDLLVPPARRRRGIGGALFERLESELRPLEPRVLRTMARETDQPTLGFLSKRGFVEEQRNWESRIDLTTFDASPYQGLEAMLAGQGIQLRTLRELRKEAGWERKLQALFWAVEQTMPDEETHTPMDPDTFARLLCQDPSLVEDAFVVAVHGDEYIGLSYVRSNTATPDVSTGLTGVVPAWRGRKVALAVKVRSLAAARALGYPSSKTWNDTRNSRMLEINTRLGFVRQPAWVQFVKKFEPENPPA